MTTYLKREAAEHRHFSFAHGPFLTAITRLHLARANGAPRALPLVLVAWVPLCVGALVRVLVGHRPHPILFDISVHTRLLIVVPLLILADRLLGERCHGAIDQLYDGRFAERGALDRVLDRAERLRDSRIAEIAIVAIALFTGQAALWGLVGPTGVFAGVSDPGSWSFVRVWYACFALPIVQVLFLRYVWHWLIWSYVVVHVSRLKLATIATHPDHAGGIGFLASPLSSFWCFVMAYAAMMASAWGTQIATKSATLQAFIPTYIGFLLAMTVLGCGPMVAYLGLLYRTRFRDTARLRRVALEYVRAFDRKWVERRMPGQGLLGSPDIQSLNDMMGAFLSTTQLRILPFGRRDVVGILVAAVIPMLPLIAATSEVEDLLKRVVHGMLTGIPL